MKVLATGGTGFVGSHSMRALLEAGHAARLLARARCSRTRELGVAFRPVEESVRDTVA
jgi:nucleoside-diphosphate-sugar epimerase